VAPVPRLGTVSYPRWRYVSRTLPELVGARDRTRIQLCGRLSVEVDGVELARSLRGKQVPLLLAYLVFARQRLVGREELIGALWPNNAPRSQDAALRTLLSRLRSSLGADVLMGRDELILELPEPVWVDIEAAVTHVERALAALEANDARRAWALAQVPLNIAGRGLLPGAQATWIESQRRELHDVRLQALEIIGRAGLILGGTQLTSVERAARALLEAEPYRESGYVLLMHALRVQGNVAEALRIFERLRSLLREELGTAPSPEALRAHEELLHPTDGGTPGASAAVDTPPGAPIVLPEELRARAATDMIGRVAELSELERWLANTGPGGRSESVLLLSGDPGIGKTRLLAEIATRAHAEGTMVLSGRSPEETLVPFQPFLEALGHYVAQAPAEELRLSVRGHGPELARLLPALRRRLPELPATDGDDSETERYRLFESVAGLLAELAGQRPVLIVLDDLQWADRPTLMLLRHLARAHQTARLSIIGAYRATEPWSEGFASAMAGLRHERLVRQIEVSGLPERDAARLVGIRLGRRAAADFVHALYAETEGNPFFIEEILRHLEDSGVAALAAGSGDLARVGLPEDVREVISRRLERLSPDALESLRVAAVIGRDFDAGLLEQVVGLDEDRYLAGLENALDAGLIDEALSPRGGYTFAHALIRETLYEGMSRPRRARIHRRIGLALEASGPQRHANALAHHFTQAAEAEDAERAIRYALQASEEATRMLAHEQAAEHYAAAIDLLRRFHPDDRQQRCRLLLDLGEALVRSGERPRAWGIFREAAALAADLGDSGALARAAIGASRRHVQPPGVIDEDLIALLEQALATTPDEPSVTRVLLLTRLAAALYYSERREDMRRLAAEATVVAARLGDPLAAALAAAARRRAYWGPGHLERRLADSTQVLRAAREAGDIDLTLQGHAWLVVDLLEAGDRAAVEAQIEAFTVGARQLRQPLFTWQAAVWRAMRALLAGHLTTADRLAGEALSAGVRAEGITAPQYYSIQLLAIRREQDRLAELEGPVREMVKNNAHRPAWRAVLGLVLTEAGRRDEARAELTRLADERFGDIPLDGDWMIAMTVLADVAIALEDRQWAQLLYERLRPYANTNVVIGIAAVCQGSTARFVGRLALVMGERTTGLAHLEQALAVNEALEAPVQAAHAQIDLATALGEGERARSLIDAAGRTARELRIPALAKRLR
jgi:DNA-binding SARP family transcriptional activator/tetratricopeptide (TPR) repeat protein